MIKKECLLWQYFPDRKFCVTILTNQNWCESVWFQPKLRYLESKVEGSGFESCRPLVVKLFLHWLPANTAPPGMPPSCWKIIDSKKVWFKYTPKIYTKIGLCTKKILSEFIFPQIDIIKNIILLSASFVCDSFIASFQLPHLISCRFQLLFTHFAEHELMSWFEKRKRKTFIRTKIKYLLETK
jgi:hypothetical protein